MVRDDRNTFSSDSLLSLANRFSRCIFVDTDTHFCLPLLFLLLLPRSVPFILDWFGKRYHQKIEHIDVMSFSIV